ncbi:hypothetical protein [Pelosinus fermentans]|uniref:Uncharacterized protein n=1 Tax=Pelosinus fermentans JBW45 TaxID=1192197 RepID=I8TU12_9FIRM|nr:hypothetical protein [Pelosinus fermentans]AJQ29748.1 hypothetical protein JBW_04417 [Pelosinus fermentans JBW45]
MKEQFLKTAIVCALIGGAIPISAFAAGSSEDSIVNNPNNKVYIERTAYADNVKAKKEAVTKDELAKLAPTFARLADPYATPETCDFAAGCV